MQINKTNLNVVHITTVDKTMPLLNNVHITEDGSTIGANTQAVIAVAPLSDKVSRGEPLTISTDTIKEVLKAIPSDKRFKELLDLVEIERVGNKVQFAFNDGKRERTIDAKTYTHEYINYKELYARELNKQPLHRVILNKKRLFTVLQTLEKLVPEKSGEFPIFVEFTDKSMILRLIHPTTGQRVIAIMVISTGEWIFDSPWEDVLKGDNYTLCSICGEKQFNTPHGICCKNGHGGAESKVPIPADKKPLQRILPKTSLLRRKV